MNFLKKVAIASALSSIAFAASAMTPIADADLSQVSGQDGVSIAANLNVNIGSFTYTNTSTNGGSIAFNNIGITGTVAATLDVVNSATFNADMFNPSATGGFGVLGPAQYAAAQAVLTSGTATAAQTAAATATLASAGTQTAALAAFYPAGSDVVKIAIPNIATDAGVNVTVGGISMGHSTASFGAMALNDIKLQGTTVYIWAH